MKNLTSYIKEGLITRKVSIKTPIKYRPKNKEELKTIIIELLKNGQKNLNCIDVSKITDMTNVFRKVNQHIPVSKIDISEWNVSNVKNMSLMFAGCMEFNSDLSNWDVSNVTDMDYLFANCYKFNSNLSKWNVSNVTDMSYMFAACEEFNSDLSKWNIHKVTKMAGMFYKCKIFNYNLSRWNVSNVKTVIEMFDGCDTLEKNNNIPTWYKGKV